MSFEVVLRCDEKNCRVNKNVNQVGALPLGWIGITFPKTTLNMESLDPKVEVDNVVFCSWSCCGKYVDTKFGKSKLKRSVKDGKSKRATVHRV